MVKVTEKTLRLVAIAGIPLGVFAFLYYASIGIITITGYTPDQTCIGSELNPCYVYVNFTANKAFTVPKLSNPLWMFNTTPYINSVRMYRSSDNIYFKEFNLSKSSASFSKGKNYSLKFVIQKDINQTLKWSFEKVDPYIFAVDKDTVFTNLTKSYADFSYGEAEFEITNPYDKSNISKNELKFNFIGSVIKNYSVFIEQEKITYVPRYKYETIYYNETVKDNITGKDINEPREYTQQTKIADLKQISTEWVILEQIPVGKSKIKIHIDWAPRTRTNVDWIPEITLVKEKSGLEKDIKISKPEWNWMNSSWQYERDIAVTMWENATDYQILLNMNLSNEKIAGKINLTYSDLRFTNNNDSNLVVYPHWVVNNTPDNYSYVRIWVKGNFTTTNNTQLRMYYGNPTAQNTSDLYSVRYNATGGDFEEGTTLNTTAWNTTIPSAVTGRINQSNGIVAIQHNSTTTETLSLFSASLVSTPIIIEGRYAIQTAIFQTSTENYFYKLSRLNNTINATSHDNTWQNRAEYGIYHGTALPTSMWDPEGLKLNVTTPLESTSVVFHDITHQYASGNIKVKIDNVSMVFNASNLNETTFNYSSATVGVYMSSWYNANHFLYIDYIFARKYLKHEPNYTFANEINYSSADFNTEYSAGINAMEFRPNYIDEQNVNATNQTNSIGLFNVTNNGTVLLSAIGMKINATQTGWTFTCANSTKQYMNISNVSFTNIYYNLAASASTMIWCQMDLNYPTSQYDFKVTFNKTI